jgi:hypothetical protein
MSAGSRCAPVKLSMSCWYMFEAPHAKTISRCACTVPSFPPCRPPANGFRVLQTCTSHITNAQPSLPPCRSTLNGRAETGAETGLKGPWPTSPSPPLSSSSESADFRAAGRADFWAAGRADFWAEGRAGGGGSGSRGGAGRPVRRARSSSSSACRIRIHVSGGGRSSSSSACGSAAAR